MLGQHDFFFLLKDGNPLASTKRSPLRLLEPGNSPSTTARYAGCYRRGSDVDDVLSQLARRFIRHEKFAAKNPCEHLRLQTVLPTAYRGPVIRRDNSDPTPACTGSARIDDGNEFGSEKLSSAVRVTAILISMDCLLVRAVSGRPAKFPRDVSHKAARGPPIADHMIEFPPNRPTRMCSVSPE